jgi:hypothetical protein
VDVPWDEIDPEIVPALHALADYGIGTFGSCRGGTGHASVMPEILFHGDENTGLYAVWLLERQGYRVWELSRHWDLNHAFPRQPWWRVFIRSLKTVPPEGAPAYPLGTWTPSFLIKPRP